MASLLIGRNDLGLVVETLNGDGSANAAPSVQPALFQVIAGGFLPAGPSVDDFAPNVLGCTVQATAINTWLVRPTRLDLDPAKVIIKGACSIPTGPPGNHILNYDIHQSGGFVTNIDLYSNPGQDCSIGFEISIVP
jgi:hypothetical protein